MKKHQQKLVLALVCSIATLVSCDHPNDTDVLQQFRKGLKNPELLQWPNDGDDPCGPPSWKHVFCFKTRVTQLQLQELGLEGTLPLNLNKLSMLETVSLRGNNLSGLLPSFRGLSNLKYAYLDYNSFNYIPSDFFDGLTNLQVMVLDGNDFNSSSGWLLPEALKDSSQLMNFSCIRCNLAGPLPDFLGSMTSLVHLRLSDNALSGDIPTSYKGMGLKTLWLSNQKGGGLTGPIDVVTTMESLESLWLHENQFMGTIPEGIRNLTFLKNLDLHGNKLVGLVPDTLADMQLKDLDLNNNMLMGPVPKFKADKVTYSSNPFCQLKEGIPCALEVMALVEFLGGLNYPTRLVTDWSGNDPCGGLWLGVTCNSDGKVVVLNLPKFNLSGELSPSLANLHSVTQIRLRYNSLSGPVPDNWTRLKNLRTLDLSGNNVAPPLPKFKNKVNLLIDGNPLLNGNDSSDNPSGSSESPINEDSDSFGESSDSKNSQRFIIAIVIPFVCLGTVVLLAVPLYIICCFALRKNGKFPQSSLVINPEDPYDAEKMVRILVANNNGQSSVLTGSGSGSLNSCEVHAIEARNLVISAQILRKVTNDFSPENALGNGGFGTVYKGELEDGTKIAVKRMEGSVVMCNTALDEFQAEIQVLSKVRHRHLVSLLGYSIEGNERLLVYEYMAQGALSKHLFHWKSSNLEPLSWKRRLNIALDVARGMEYLHSLAHRCFIHRDLKSSNILLDDDFRAKVSDFGLVKLAPDDEKSVVTRLAGTFGYLAPEYAVTGKITTKGDVFSFGVVLMELLTGLPAVDESRPEECHYLVSYFWRIISDKEKLKATIDKTMDITDETFESVCIIAELAGHCSAREASQRPEMGHAVNILSPLVKKWKPLEGKAEVISGIDYGTPLDQVVKRWQEHEGSTDAICLDIEESKGSGIPARSGGLDKSFTSKDGR